jgi:hypothetical protein
LRIEAYFQQMREAIETSSVVQAFNVAYDKRSSHEGFIRGEVFFVDGSMLHLREFVDVETTPDRLTYVYQYVDSTQQLVFRYDNTGHHRKRNLPTYPHHQHKGREDNVIASPAPDLSDVLNEIEPMVQLPS